MARRAVARPRHQQHASTSSWSCRCPECPNRSMVTASPITVDTADGGDRLRSCRSRCSSACRFRAPTRRSTSSTTRPASTTAPAYGGGASVGSSLMLDGVDHARPRRRQRVDLLQLQHHRRGPGRRPGRARQNAAASPAPWSARSPSPAATGSRRCPRCGSQQRQPERRQHLARSVATGESVLTQAAIRRS